MLTTEVANLRRQFDREWTRRILPTLDGSTHHERRELMRIKWLIFVHN